eukprot:CAMPEP_0198467338 /NCGR_PEP_ID=MMETSP1456-20131121/4607_1 /TAXON_ID=1461544 ORGANISM="Unidentified sp., Strain RCC1871" /NCGR_SAMPLE_ID=MMETSP1456 /ASSEMBLY_ACC=CAM_ASM_001119 /LENGTH=50 /DNA_ID=CAMNT_0044193357 /DNA_START=87 /DNA_END=239 /DNA_ORIENTATION=-
MTSTFSPLPPSCKASLASLWFASGTTTLEIPTFLAALTFSATPPTGSTAP